MAGCGQLATAATPPPAPARDKTVPSLVVPNETMNFVIAFRGIQIANVQTAIGTPGWLDGKHAVVVKSRGHTEGLIALVGGLRWELETQIDLDRGTPIDDHEEAWATLVGERPEHNDHHGGEHHDLHSAICALRGWHGAANEHLQVDMALGGGSFEVEIWEAAHDTIDGHPALRFDGIAGRGEKFPFSLWLSDDLGRVPLRASTKTELGTVEVNLIEYG